MFYNIVHKFIPSNIQNNETDTVVGNMNTNKLKEAANIL